MVTIEMPDMQQILLDGIQAAVLPALLATAELVPTILKDRAILDNEDVDGNQMPMKKPRPQKHPKNFPNLPLIQNDDPDLMNNARWTKEQTGDLEVTVTYDPPEHFKYLAAKGRDWIREDSINAKAREQIVADITDRIGGRTVIISAVNRDAALLTDIVNTLSQIKDAQQPNKPLTIQYAANTCTVDFYTDAARTVPVFSENTTDNPGSFTASAGRTAYVPPDAAINGAAGISTTHAQPLYYITATFSDGHVEQADYRNADNLLLGQVMVSTQKNPPFASNQVGAIVVPCQQKEVNSKQTDDYRYSLVEFDIYLQLFVFNWKNLSEFDRLKTLMNVNNLIRDGLYADKYRAGNACLYDNDIDGTFVGMVTPTPSKDVLTGNLKVKCAFLSLSTTY